MSKKILLAEDSLTIQKVFELTFRQSNVSLTMVDNGVDAVRLAGEISPDLVVADVSLPGKDGFEVAAELRNQEKTRWCPVLVLSGTLAPFDEEKYKSCGAAGVLFKPFESQELIDKVEGLLSGSAGSSPEEAKETARTSRVEPWDFSDVIEEVEEETAAAAPPVLHRGEELLPGASVASIRGEVAASLGEFDVSMEDIAPPAPPAFSAAPEPPRPEAAAETAHMESEYFDDSPQAVTDLSAVLDAFEEIEEIDMVEEMELPGKETEALPVPEDPSFQPPASLPAIEAVEPPRSVPPPSESPPEAGEGVEAIVEAGAPEGAGAYAGRGRTGAGDAGGAGAADAFSARAQEILGRIAAETMEKVMWETMDRLSAEFSEKIREAVEKVAWEVIPATAETLIREEISRIRRQAEKRSS